MSKALDEEVATSEHPLSSAKYILGLLFVGNLLNYYDRALPAVVLEQIKADFSLDDAQVGLLASAFVLVAAIAGVPLGRLGDRIARKTVAGWGLAVWSLCTAAGGVLSNFWLFFGSRVGVGVGEASYTPATGSLIADLYPPRRRSRAIALFTLGFPIGTMLAFFTAGAIATAFGTWRAPFLIAAVPGVIVAFLILRVREPARGAADALPVAPDEVPPPVTPGAPRRGATIGSLLRVRSMYGLVIAYAGYNFGAYSIGTFIAPVLQRYFGLELVSAGAISGVIIGVAGLIGLLIGGRVLDAASARSATARHWVAAAALAAAAIFCLLGLAAGQASLGQFVLFLSLGYLFSVVYLAAYVPITADVVAPEQRSTAFGIIFAVGLFIGGAGGPVLVGALSDSLASTSALPAAAASAEGLKTAMLYMVPAAYLVAALGMVLAVRFAVGDHQAMTNRRIAR